MMRNTKREFQVSQHNEAIGAYKLIAELMKDPEFDIYEPMTDTYLQEVGYILGWKVETTMRIVGFMYDNHLLN